MSTQDVFFPDLREDLAAESEAIDAVASQEYEERILSPNEEDLVPLTDEEEMVYFPEDEDLVPLSDEENTNFEVDKEMGGGYSPELAKGLEGEITASNAANTWDAATQFDIERSDAAWYEDLFYNLSIPQQAVVRQSVNLLENIGELSTEEARRILSNNDVSFTDVAQVYTRNDGDSLMSYVLPTLGFVADVVLDPLNFVGIGAGKASKGLINVGDKVFDLAKISSDQRKWYKGVQKVGVVIDKYNEVKKLSDPNFEDMYKLEYAKLRDKQIGFDDFSRNLGLSGETKNVVNEIANKAITDSSTVRRFAEGELSPVVGIRIPFTNIHKEYNVPILEDLMSGVGTGLLAANNEAGQLLKSMGVDFNVSNLLRSFRTRTGFNLFDEQSRRRLGHLDAMKTVLSTKGKEWRNSFKVIQETVGDAQFESLMKDLIDEIELRPLDFDFARELGTKYNASALDLLTSTGETAEDIARMNRLRSHPSLLKFIDETAEANREMIHEFQKRGLPLDELDPFGPGWVNNYIKHVVSKEYLQTFAKGAQENRILTEAIDKLSSLGKVDPSAAGRKYKGSINEANEFMLKEKGVKLFVDDPIYLISRRLMEMQKTIADFDLMEAAAKYKKSGIDPGSGWVEFNWNHFADLTLADESTDIAKKLKKSAESSDDVKRIKQTFDAYVPKEYKTGEKIFLPSDMYSRMLHQVNAGNYKDGWDRYLTAIDKFHNWFSNTALFGTGYLGQNIIGNSLNYLTNFGVQALPDFFRGSKAMMTGAGEFPVKLMSGKIKNVPYEDLLLEAQSMGIMRSSFYGELSMDDLAENIYSTMNQRKSLGKKIGNVADTVFLWKYNRQIAEISDLMPKFGGYAYYRRLGFSKEAAAEQVEKYFYHYSLGGKAQNIISRVVPFSRFSIKTAEMFADELRTFGGLGRLSVPEKVSDVFEGKFVEDQDTRMILNSVLPGYMKIKSLTLGPILPGQRELLYDIPWATNTVATLSQAAGNLHPLLVAGAGYINYQTSSESDRELNFDYEKKRLSEALFNMAVPAYLKHAMVTYDIATNAFGGHLANMYESKRPAPDDAPPPGQDDLLTGASTAVTQFKSAEDFAEYMKEEVGQDWLFNFMTTGNVLAQSHLDQNPFKEGEMKHRVRETAKGEYLRRHFRQYSFGSASITKQDQNFLVNYWALNRRFNKLRDTLYEKLVDIGDLVDADELTKDEALIKHKDLHPEALEILQVKQKQQALSSFYDFIYRMKEEYPEANIDEIIFGEDTLDYSQKPEAIDMFRGTQEYSEEQIDAILEQPKR